MGVSSFPYRSLPRLQPVAPTARTGPVPKMMKRLSPAAQRIILAFTTGLFLACAAQVSGQSGGLASTIQSVAP